MNTPENSIPSTTGSTRGWRIARRLLIGAAIFATVTAAFYAEEDWRGKRAWEECKRDMTAKGEDVEWTDFIPEPVSDDQNVFGVKKMQEWFVGRGTNELSMLFDRAWSITNRGRITVADVTIGLPGSSPPPESLVLRWDDPATRAAAARAISNAIGPSTADPRGHAVMLRKPEEIIPAKIFLKCKTAPTVQELSGLYTDDIFGAAYSNFGGQGLRVESGGVCVYQLTLTAPYLAADFIDGTDTVEPELAIIRQALERPYVRMNGDYLTPDSVPAPNFVCLRDIAQVLAARAKCHLLTGQPDAAVEDLALMHRLCRILVPSSGKPITLVAAMINVAISGLYTATIGDGFRLHGWHEPQLAELENQVKEINLLPILSESLRGGAAYCSHELEVRTPAELEGILWGDSSKDFFRKLRDPGVFLLGVGPRGWLYQSMTAAVKLWSDQFAGYDVTNDLVLPEKIDSEAVGVEKAGKHWSPWYRLAGISTPNLIRAASVMANNQTQVNETLVACALERYRVAHHEYPGALEMLAPQYVDKIPHDIIGGQPLHYRRQGDGQFLLYSVGWDGTDDGGVAGKATREGDWVWAAGR